MGEGFFASPVQYRVRPDPVQKRVNNTERFVMIKYLQSFLQVKYEQLHNDECQFFIHSCFWKNESLNHKRTHTVFSDYKHQLSVNSSVCLQEFKLGEWAVTEENNSDG